MDVEIAGVVAHLRHIDRVMPCSSFWPLSRASTPSMRKPESPSSSPRLIEASKPAALPNTTKTAPTEGEPGLPRLGAPISISSKPSPLTSPGRADRHTRHGRQRPGLPEGMPKLPFGEALEAEITNSVKPSPIRSPRALNFAAVESFTETPSKRKIPQWAKW